MVVLAYCGCRGQALKCFKFLLETASKTHVSVTSVPVLYNSRVSCFLRQGELLKIVYTNISMCYMFSFESCNFFLFFWPIAATGGARQDWDGNFWISTRLRLLSLMNFSSIFLPHSILFIYFFFQPCLPLSASFPTVLESVIMSYDLRVAQVVHLIFHWRWKGKEMQTMGTMPDAEAPNIEVLGNAPPLLYYIPRFLWIYWFTVAMAMGHTGP